MVDILESSDKPIFVPPLNSSGLSNLDFALLGKDTKALNSEVAREIDRQVGWIGRSDVSKDFQREAVHKSFKLMTLFRGDHAERSSRLFESAEKLFKKVETSKLPKETPWSIYRQDLGKMVASLPTWDDVVNLLTLMKGDRELLDTYIDAVDPLLQRKPISERTEFAKQVYRTIGKNELTNKMWHDLARKDKEGKVDLEAISQALDIWDIYDKSDPEIWMELRLLLFDHIKNNLPEKIPYLLQQAENNFPTLVRNERVRRFITIELCDYARADPLYVAKHIPLILRQLREISDFSYSGELQGVYQTLSDCIVGIGKLDEIPETEKKQNVRKIARIAFQLGIGEDILDYDEVAELTSEEIYDLAHKDIAINDFSVRSLICMVDTLTEAAHSERPYVASLAKLTTKIIEDTDNIDFKQIFLVRLPHIAGLYKTQTGSREYFRIVYDQVKQLEGQIDLYYIVTELSKWDYQFDQRVVDVAHFLLRKKPDSITSRYGVNVEYPEGMKKQFKPLSQQEIDKITNENYIETVRGEDYPHNDRAYFGTADNRYQYTNIMPFKEEDGTETDPVRILSQAQGKLAKVVDFGCGWRGRALEDLKGKYPNVEGLGISGNVQQPTGQLNQDELKTRIELHSANLSFSRETAGKNWIGETDIGMSISTLQYPADPWGILAQMTSFIKPGGTLYATVREKDLLRALTVYDPNGGEVPLEQILANINMMDCGFTIQWGTITYPTLSKDQQHINFALTIRKDVDCKRATLPLTIYYAEFAGRPNKIAYIYRHPRNNQDDLFGSYTRIGSNIEDSEVPRVLLPKQFQQIKDTLEMGSGIACVTGMADSGKSTLMKELAEYFRGKGEVLEYDGHVLGGGKEYAESLGIATTVEVFEKLEKSDKPLIFLFDAADHFYSFDRGPEETKTRRNELRHRLWDALYKRLQKGDIKVVLTRHGEEWDKSNEVKELKAKFNRIIQEFQAEIVTLKDYKGREITFDSDQIEWQLEKDDLS